MLCSVPLSDVKAKSPRWRFNISLLSNQTFITSLKEYIKEFLEINMPSDVDPQILWERFTVGILILYAEIVHLSNPNLSVDWERVWSNLSLTSKNLAYRLIHFKVIHRAYITPYKRFKMKLQSNLNCHICNTTSSGTFLHMFWECPVVISLWTHVNLVLSSLLRIDWSVNPSLCLLNDDSGLCISSMQKRMLFAGFTAAKKTIIQNWFTPHMCRKT